MSTWLVAMLLLASHAAPSAEALKTRTMSLSVRDGVVVGFADLRTKQGHTARDSAALTGLRRLEDRHLWNDQATVRTSRDNGALTVTATWREQAGESRVVTRMTPQADGDVVVTQRARSASPGVVGVQWGWVVPDTWQVLVPGHSGLRYGQESATSPKRFDYPRSWEAQFVLLQGERGGVLIYAEDDATRFKALHLDRHAGELRIGLETRCTAPFEPITETESVRWRIHVYEGDWLVGAGVYRAWAAKAFALTALVDRRPAWVRDIQLVVIAGLGEEVLTALARRVAPQQTLIYVPGWRRDGYDRNYPDYTPVDGFAEKMARARAMGFRVMLHVNYFGVTLENPAYEQMKPYHCRDPLSKSLLCWDWQRATPPVKFAYINPAARAWRDLFVQRMVTLCERLKADALHLDQTLCIYNHAGGPIDGMNMMQGNLALHRQLREALPDVALSGEGLNEITCRYEAFAQRHVYGINHVDREWSDPLIAQAHPVSSAMLAPYTTIYGYLGMPNPEPSDFYFAWRRAYERFGVIPTLSHPSPQQLAEPPPAVRVLLREAGWFQKHRPVPDFTPGWRPETVFAYRLGDGGRAAYRRDRCGVALVETAPKAQTVSRRISGAASALLPGTIPDWRAYDRDRLIGLRPDQSYVYLDEPRDPDAFHVSSLPESAEVAGIGLRSELATVRLDDRRTVVARLWDFAGPSRCGEVLPNGKPQRVEGAVLDSPAGTNIRPEGQGIFAHPPWRGAGASRRGTKAKATATAWTEFDLRLPPDKPARFEAGVGLRSSRAAEQSDGVTFCVTVRDTASPGEPMALERHAKGWVPEPIALDLTRFRGRSVTIRLATDPGPAGSVAFDWALWTRPRIVLTEPYAAPIEVTSPRPILAAIAGDRRKVPIARTDNRYALTASSPGTTYLLFRTPQRVSAPATLCDLPFSATLVLRDGTEQSPHGFMQPQRSNSTVGGVTRAGLFAHPPPYGQMHVDWLLELPETPLKLTGFAGIRDGARGKSHGVGFRIAVNGRQRWARDVQADGTWAGFDVSLAALTGRRIVLTLVTDALGDHICDWAQWADLRLLPRR